MPSGGITQSALVRYVAKEPPEGRDRPRRGELLRVMRMTRRGAMLSLGPRGSVNVPLSDLELVVPAERMGAS